MSSISHAEDNRRGLFQCLTVPHDHLDNIHQDSPVPHMKLVILLRHMPGPVICLAHMATRLCTGLACFVPNSKVNMQPTALSKHGIFLLEGGSLQKRI
ncbi:uncharacterized protein Bfra_007414 [Botrytis fragariae]|uniref:Uncharacterized protein n=1 Tax=Botrytis fragariae TaxID=1964551 RepID=A0A8H6EDE0_9HELO|nr:uncharacterized protein Bfra_007414 [Botrytis fragariae]KAF5868217.1 hypothetical protein Bfra_007414 [Botrytis fragariae]